MYETIVVFVIGIVVLVLYIFGMCNESIDKSGEYWNFEFMGIDFDNLKVSDLTNILISKGFTTIDGFDFHGNYNGIVDINIKIIPHLDIVEKVYINFINPPHDFIKGIELAYFNKYQNLYGFGNTSVLGEIILYNSRTSVNISTQKMMFSNRNVTSSIESIEKSELINKYKGII